MQIYKGTICEHIREKYPGLRWIGRAMILFDDNIALFFTQSAAAAAKETKTIIVDDPEIAEVGLDDDEFAGKYTFGEDGEITLTGTAKQIAKMIAAIEGVGGEIIG